MMEDRQAYPAGGAPTGQTAHRPGILAQSRFSPRWHKVFADLWGNKIRTLLVVASVAVGLFAIGSMATIREILLTDMRESYAQVKPMNIQVSAANLTDDLVETVRSIDGVKDAEAVRAFDAMVRTGPEEWKRITLTAIPDFEDQRINLVRLEQGIWPPADRQVAIERNKAHELPAGVGGMLEIKLPSGTIRQLPVVGQVHDQTIGSVSGGGGYFMAPIQGYISTDTLEWLEQPDAYNLLLVTAAENSDDETHLRELAYRISETIEDGGGLVYNAAVRETHDHPNSMYIEAMSGILLLLGGLVVFLSAFLITNTLSSLLNQQAQQIAIMKTIGARSKQVVSIFIALIFVYGLLALLISLPLSSQAAFGLLDFLAVQLNFNVMNYRMVPLAVILQVVIALIVPQAAGIWPVLRGARVKVQEAFSGSISERDPAQMGWFDRQIAALSTGRRRFKLSRPLLISLRNTFRHKGRLVLTLITLMLGGAIFIATFNVRASLEQYIERLGKYFIADVNITLQDPQRITKIQEMLLEMPQVEAVEGWAVARSELLLENDQAGDAVQLLAPPGDTPLVEPILLKGRWVRKGDENAIALSERFMASYPDLEPGDTIRLRVNGEETEWVVVGFFQLAGNSAGYIAYTNYEYLSEVIHEPNRAAVFRITARRGPDGRKLTLDEQRALGLQIEQYLQNRGIDVSEVTAGYSMTQDSAKGLDILTTFLLIMALLTAAVGSIGLMGTMSMNVIDRTREIGVMRAIGASDRAVMNLVMVEGILIGTISWLLGTLLSIPISFMLSDIISMAVFQNPSVFAFTLTGPLAWLAAVIVLSTLASVIPARTAARLTIREALAYE